MYIYYTAEGDMKGHLPSGHKSEDEMNERHTKIKIRSKQQRMPYQCCETVRGAIVKPEMVRSS